MNPSACGPGRVHCRTRGPGSRLRGRVRHVLVSASATLLVSGLVVALAAVSGPPAAYAAQPAVGLGTATSYAVLAGSTVTNTGPSVISGDLGLSPGSAVTGFPPGQVNSGTMHVADAVALQAQNDLTTAYNDAAGRSPFVDKTNVDLGGSTLVAGVYRASTGMALTGTVTLDAAGDPAAVFIFQAGSTLITASNSRVALLNGAQACNVFWQVGSSATIGTTTRFVGTVMALTSITLQNGATVQGRVLARNGQVSLDDNRISRPTCAAVPPAPTGTATPTGSTVPTGPGATPPLGDQPLGGGGPPGEVAPPGDGAPPANGGPPNNGGPPDNGGPPNDGSPPTSPPWVPTGHPPTGRAPTPSEPASSGLWLGGALGFLGLAFGIIAARRPKRVARR